MGSVYQRGGDAVSHRCNVYDLRPDGWATNGVTGVRKGQLRIGRVGVRSAHDQNQLLAIQKGKSAIIGDRSGRYTTIWYDDEGLNAGPSTEDDLALFIVRQLEKSLPAVLHEQLARVRRTLGKLKR